MKRFVKILITAQAAMLLIAGCGAGNGTAAVTEDNNGAEISAEETEEKEEVQSESAEEIQDANDDTKEVTSSQTSASYDDPGSLPGYSYQGTEDYYAEINDYLVSHAKEEFGPELPDVFIPYSIIVQTDEKDPEDIIAYGIYSVDGYDLLNTTLENTTGSMSYGAFHLKKNDDGTFEVKKADLALVDEDAIDLFAPVEGLYDKVIAVPDEEIENAREESIAEYVNANGLNITQWQDYSHDPVAVKGAPDTPEEAQFYVYDSPLGYQITYDLREFSLMPSEDEDMYGKIRESDNATLMVIKKAEEKDADAAINAVMSDFEGGNSETVDDTIGGISCRRAEHDEKLDDGRIFRYVCYAVPANDGVITLLLETTVEDSGAGMSTEELEKAFNGMLSTFSAS